MEFDIAKFQVPEGHFYVTSSLPRLADEFSWWCLSHNLEVAAGLAAMKHLGWVSGFSAGKTIKEFCDV